MADRLELTQAVALGAEVTAGTAVATPRRMMGVSIEPAVEFEGDMFRTMGQKYNTVFSPNKEWSSATIKGKPLYNEIPILLEGAVKKVTATQIIPTTGLAFERVYTSSNIATDTVQTFTVEQGDATRAHKLAYGVIKELGFNFTRSSLEVSGSMIGRLLTDSITLTASPTGLPVLPILPTQVTVKVASTQAGLAGASALARTFTAEWKLADRFNPLWVLNSANSSWVTHIETAPKLTMKLKMMADAEGMAFLPIMRAGSTYFIEINCATTSYIEATTPYSLKIQTAVSLVKPNKFENADGVYAIGWDFEGIYDETWGKSFEITSVSTTDGLYS